MKRNKIQTYICRGFNNYFEVPKIEGDCRATYRTAFVLKKHDFFDEWEVYDAMVWRVIMRVSEDLSAKMKINCCEAESGYVDSLVQWRQHQSYASHLDPDYGIDEPGEILFWSKKDHFFLMKFEDWSDIGKNEPYACSYTFSFYSTESSTDAMIEHAIRNQLTEEPEVEEICDCQESSSAKWYWPILNILKDSNLLIYSALTLVLAVTIFLILIAGANSS